MDCEEKSRFTSRDKARRAARIVRSDKGVKMRVYGYKHCGGFHLTTLILTREPTIAKHPHRRDRQLGPGESMEGGRRGLGRGDETPQPAQVPGSPSRARVVPRV